MITEIGWATGGGHPGFSTSYSGQARRLDHAYRTLLRVRYRYKRLGALWLNFRRGNAKPAWRTLIDFTGGRG